MGPDFNGAAVRRELDGIVHQFFDRLAQQRAVATQHQAFARPRDFDFDVLGPGVCFQPDNAVVEQIGHAFAGNTQG